MRVFIFIGIMVGLMILLNFAGINTTTGQVLSNLNIINEPENLMSSILVAAIIAVFALAATGGIIIGTFSRTPPTAYLVAGVASFLILFVGDFMGIVLYAKANYEPYVWRILLLIMGALSVGFIISVLDWWKGTD